MKATMDKCTECGSGRLEVAVLPEHTEDLGGIVVNLRNAVCVYRCSECGAEEPAIPDLIGLAQAAAMARALIPVQLSGRDIRFMRKALDMTQQQFAETIGLDSVETISRWEKGVRGVGGYTEKLVRHTVCALLHDHVPALDYDPKTIVQMKVRQLREGEALPPLVLDRVLVKHGHTREEAWDADVRMAA